MPPGGAVTAMRSRIVRAFARTGAFSEADAKNLDELDLHFFAHGMFRRMEQRGIIIQTHDCRYYMDKGYFEARQRRLKFVVPIALIAAIAVIVIAVIASK